MCKQVSAPSENAVRYLSMHDNKYMRYFRGHTEEITSLDISPNSDAFLTAAKVDPRIRHHQASSHAPPLAVADSTI